MCSLWGSNGGFKYLLKESHSYKSKQRRVLRSFAVCAFICVSSITISKNLHHISHISIRNTGDYNLVIYNFLQSVITTQHMQKLEEQKLKLYTYIHMETWTMTKKEEQALLIFERKIFRRIYGPKYEDGEGKSRTNRELEELSKG